MANMTRRITETAALFAMLYAARRYYRNWGTTKAECQMRLPGDALVGDPAIQTTEAVYIDAPPSAVWPWLLQMGQDRGGFYGCEGLKNLAGLRHRDADRVHAEWQQLCGGGCRAPGSRRLDGATKWVDVERRRDRARKVHRAQCHATRSALECGVVIPPPAALGGPGPTSYPRQNRLAPPRRSVCHGTSQAGDRSEHAGIAAWNQTPSRAAAYDKADTPAPGCRNCSTVFLLRVHRRWLMQPNAVLERTADAVSALRRGEVGCRPIGRRQKVLGP